MLYNTRSMPKLTKLPEHPAKTLISLDSLIRAFTDCIKKVQVLSYPKCSDTVKTDQIEWMTRLIWVFTRCTGCSDGFVKSVSPSMRWKYWLHNHLPFYKNNMNHIMTKPVNAKCKQQRCRSACVRIRTVSSVSVTHCLDSGISVDSTFKISRLHLADWFEFYLVAHLRQVLSCPDSYEPRHKKTRLRGLRPGKTQTGLHSHKSKV